MSVRITFRVGDSIPESEVLSVGEPLWSPTENRLGIGFGGGQPLWYPSIDPINQDIVLQSGALIRGVDGGNFGRAGFDSTDTFSVYTSGGLQVRVNDNSTTFSTPVEFQQGGTLTGFFNTNGGEFTNLAAQAIQISPTSGVLNIVDQNNQYVGQITSTGITSLSQQQLMTCVAAYNESIAQFFRNTLSSGFVASRAYAAGRPFDPKYKLPFGGFSAMSMHSHPNYNGVCGLAEITAMVNGYHVQTRHNDYRIMCSRPINDATYGQNGTTPQFGDRYSVGAPPIPQSVLSLPTGFTGTTLNSDLTGTQAEWMQNVYTNRPDLCVYYLSYLEVWVEAYDGTVLDIATSPRQSDYTNSFATILADYTTYLRSGFKLPVENIPLLPGVIVAADPVTGQPTLGYINWRISSVPVGTMATTQTSLDIPLNVIDQTTGEVTNTIDWTWNLIAMPYDSALAAAGTVNSSNVFTLRRQIHQRWFAGVGRTEDIIQGGGQFLGDILETQNTWSNVADLNSALFDTFVLEAACRQCPGFDGLGIYAPLWQRDPLNYIFQGVKIYQSSGDNNGLPYYSNAYAMNSVDAVGINNQQRGFNDNNLFTSLTFNWQSNVLGGASFMIPLEFVIRTPRENWNPLNVPYTTTPTGDGTAAKPYSGWSDYGYYYRTPTGVFTGGTNGSTQADTAAGAYMQTPSGIALMLPSGINIYEGDGYRRRFCVAPEANQFSSVNRDLQWLKFQLKNVLKQVASGTVTSDTIDDAF